MKAAFDRGPDELRSPRLTKVNHVRGVRVVVPQGAFDETGAEVVELQVDEDDGPVVIDLGECILTSVDVLQFLFTARLGRPEASISVACRRATGRQMLHRAGVDRVVAVFFSVEDAVQAHLFRSAGLGPGWSLDLDT